jgi:hypothetical protein
MRARFLFTISCLLSLLILAAGSCSQTEELPAPEELKQFIRFELNGLSYNWTESDSVVFKPLAGTSYNSGNPDSTIFVASVNLLKEHKIDKYSSWYEGINFIFNHKVKNTSLAQNGKGCWILRTPTFKELFAPGNWNYLLSDCQERTHRKHFVMGFNILLVNGKVRSGSSAIVNCRDTPLNQSSSSFLIDSSMEYVHPTLGKTFLITGKFNLLLNTDAGVMQVTNGAFKMLVRECNVQ